jgi:hypothetical protein
VPGHFFGMALACISAFCAGLTGKQEWPGKKREAPEDQASRGHSVHLALCPSRSGGQRRAGPRRASA